MRLPESGPQESVPHAPKQMLEWRHRRPHKAQAVTRPKMAPFRQTLWGKICLKIHYPVWVDFVNPWKYLWGPSFWIRFTAAKERILYRFVTVQVRDRNAPEIEVTLRLPKFNKRVLILATGRGVHRSRGLLWLTTEEGKPFADHFRATIAENSEFQRGKVTYLQDRQGTKPKHH